MDTPRWPTDWPLVTLDDGPLAGHWYFERAEHGDSHSWEAMVERQELAVQNYEPTNEEVQSRKFEGVRATVWRLRQMT